MSHDVPQDPPTLSKAVPLLTAARAFTDIAQSLGVTRGTISRWLDDPDFARACERRWDEIAPISTAEIESFMLRSFITLFELVEFAAPQESARAFRTDPERVDEERQREARKRFLKPIADAQNRHQLSE